MVHALLHAPNARAQQGLNNLWLGGFEDESPPPWGGVDLDFLSGNLVISTAVRTMDYKRTNTNITDSSGDLLFSTNGAYLANATGDTLENGTGLNPSTYTSNYPEGLHIQQAVLILPKPGNSNLYYLFHSTIDDQIDYFAQRLYVTTIDMSLDGGLGGVVTKNQIAIDSLLTVGKITAVRHANGRDWWVLCHAFDSQAYYTLLITPNGIADLQYQSIGMVRSEAAGQLCFSPAGDRFAYYCGRPGEGLEIFHFDRCTGLLSDPIFVASVVPTGTGGVAFSSDGHYLYISAVEDVYQYDTEAPDIAASEVHIAHWDGFYSPSPPFATLFDIAQLAPDGKIYIGTGNGTLHLHVIHDPDEQGLACNIEQHGIELPRYSMNSLPNHPNYHLGPVDGSECDSLGINTGLHLEDKAIVLQAFPNPSDGRFTLSYPVRNEAGELEVRDATGRVVLHERIPQWSQVHRVKLAQPVGLYHATMRWGNAQGSVTVLVE
ncbi:MAG: T9SS type A sorting domain-containing protein [Flavobacteriales bacterium]